MIKVKYIMQNDDGLHARPAAALCKAASKFKSSIFIFKDGEEYEAKSILMLMSAGAVKGDTIEIVADGEDEREAVDTIIDVLDKM